MASGGSLMLRAEELLSLERERLPLSQKIDGNKEEG
jgi:hypothetical protein